MSILITGATGLIGKKIVKLLLERDITVHYLTTRKEKIESSSHYRGFYWNPTIGEIDEEALVGVEVIIHLAGASVSKPWTKAYKKEIIDSRTQTTQLLYDSLVGKNHGVQQIIAASGISIYPSSFEKLYDEDNETASTSFLGNVTKVWESAVDKFKELNIAVNKVRTGIVLDRNEGALNEIIKPVKMGLGAPLASGRQWQSWIHINDIAGIYLHILQNKLEGIYNGVAPGPVTNKKLTIEIGKRLKKSLWLPNVPKFVLKTILGERSALVLESQLVSADKIQESGYSFEYVNLEAALEDLI